jgi:hypothetical protein
MPTTLALRPRRALAVFAGLVLLTTSCDENLPSGPANFATTLKIVVPHDTVVIGDSSAAQAQAVDADGHVIQGLTFKWTSADASVLALSTPAANSDDAAAGRSQILLGKKTGRSVVTLSLPDSRFASSEVSRTQTVVVGGVRILSTRDSTLSAVEDTVMAIATSLVRTSAGLTPKASQGIKWSQRGSHTAVIGAGDTIRYISRSNGADTLIASHDFCLAGAKCADTAVIHVSQQLTMTLSSKTLLAWSFSDSLAPVVKLADRRGIGLPGAFVRFVPLTAADSTIVKVSGVVGTSNTADGTVATPRLIAIGNGTANVAVAAFGPDNQAIGAAETITMAVRQVARRVAVEPLRVDVSEEDSIPFRSIARDARGFRIADASISITTTGLNTHGIWAGPTSVPAIGGAGTITPTLAGVARPELNPLAPQIPVVSLDMQMNIRQADTIVAGSAGSAVAVSGIAFDSTGQPAVGRLVAFSVSSGATPASAQVNSVGNFTQTWTLPTVADHYTLTGVLAGSALDPFDHTVVRRSVTVNPDVPSETRTTVTITNTTLAANATATLTITVRDRFNNLVKTAVPAEFVTSANAGGGTFSGAACTLGICTVTYTAKATPGPDVIRVRINGTDVLGSPINIVVQ